MSREMRKRTLVGMLDAEENSFYFHGKKVCTLSDGLSFSKSLQACVKGTPRARASSSIQVMPRKVRRHCLRDYIREFIDKLTDTVGDSMPHKDERHLPHRQKLEVWELYRKNMEESLARGSPEGLPNLNYVYRIWNEEMSTVKIRRHHAFAKYNDCEFFRVQLKGCGLNENRAAPLRAAKKAHLDSIRM